MFGWNISDTNLTRGAVAGYASENVNRKEKIPPSHGESCGPQIVADQTNRLSSECGDAEQPCSCSLVRLDKRTTTTASGVLGKERSAPNRETKTKNDLKTCSLFFSGETHSSLCVPFLTSGGSTRIDRRSDCRRKHADALFGLEPSDVFFADVVGLGVDVVVVVVAPRRPLILLRVSISFKRCVTDDDFDGRRRRRRLLLDDWRGPTKGWWWSFLDERRRRLLPRRGRKLSLFVRKFRQKGRRSVKGCGVCKGVLESPRFKGEKVKTQRHKKDYKTLN